MSTKKSKKLPLIPLLDAFIMECKRGRYLQRNGKPLSKQSIAKYEYLHLHLVNYSNKTNQVLEIIPAQKLTQRQLTVQKNYWKKLYNGFTNYLYHDRGCFDNYVGRVVKTLRTFLNYLNDECNIQTSPYKRYLYVRSEEIPIISLSPERLNFLIYNEEFHESLPPHLQRAKDIFVFGCTIALRYIDLQKLKQNNLVKINGVYYLHCKSQKTETHTKVLLPDYALNIINRHQIKGKYLLPQICNGVLNNHIKTIAELAGWTEEFIKTREQKGKAVVVYKNKATKTHYRFCDLLSSHSMRRTAITTMLMMGMNELMVRNISGHAANSKEFFKYVALVQHYLDTETEQFHSKLKALETRY